MEQSCRLGQQTQVTLHVTVPRDDKRDSRTCELWIVRVSDGVYVRALHGPRSWWYRQVLTTPAQLWCVEGIVDVRFEPVEDPALLDLIDSAYEEKYGLGWPGPVGFITTADARAATLRVIPTPDPDGTFAPRTTR
ncbi:DUF2255 family protein [Streptomyces sp. NPDC102406]|uniref:DUF2255 family protein n=1 Tax=Streptomyces sp. NPDC102406 TaxID=3366171 RepID=UPI003818E0DE